MTKKNWLILGLIIAGAVLLRIIPQWDKVFVDGQVWFRGVDPWYHMRLADNMLHNFPHSQYWDWFTLYPTGGKVGFNPMMSWMIAGAGQFMNHEVAGAFLPPIAGGLTLVSVFFLGKELFSKKVGYLACVLTAILPGEFLHRSLLGFTDHHVLEAMFATTTVLFLVLMLKYHKLRYAILAGVTLGAYLLSWSGGHFLILILWIWFVIQVLYYRLKNLPENDLCRNTLVVFLVAFFMYLPYMRFMNASIFNYAPFFLAIITPVWLWNRGNRKATLMSVLLPMAIAGIALYLTDYHRTILSDLRSVFWGGATTIQEATPSELSTILATAGVSFFLFVGGLILYFKDKGKNLLFLVWAIILLAAQIGQRRWGYYFVVPMSLLASYFAFHAASWVKTNVRAFAVAIIILFTIVPSIRGTIGVATLPNNITPDWYNTLTWMRENTPEPYWDYQGDYYSLKIYDQPHYGVLSWWDYGHWITRIAQRVPLSNPAYQDPQAASKFFCSKTEEEALKEIEGMDVRYILVSADMVGGKYYAIQLKGGKDTDLLDSVVYKMWNNQLKSYKLIREEGRVKLYEKVG